jgi:sulfatase maturation enzyme AslB (radical SAM superfamily)
MSNYNQDANKAEKQLNFISKSMCYAKWAQVSLHLTNGMTNSCYHPPLHKINVDQIKHNPLALHNTDQKKQERKLMLEGKRPEGCSYCWKIEDMGNRSDRIYRSGEYWAQNARKDIIQTMEHGDINPRYVEVNFNQACNFKCMYCSPHLSTEWENEIKQQGPFIIRNSEGAISKHNDIMWLEQEGLMPLKVKQDDNPYLTAFWTWWPNLYKNLDVFRITGGEPLMDVNTFKVLDHIYKNPNSDLEVSITTNMCPPKPELMDKFIEKLVKLEEIQIWENKEKFNKGSGNYWYVNMALKNFSLFVSLDSVGKQAEYIRTGLDYELMQQNIIKYLTSTDNTTLTFINTFNAFSVLKIKEFLQYVLSLRQQFSKDKLGIKYKPIYDPYNTHPDYVIYPTQRIWFDVPLLRYPTWQSIELLPAGFEKYIEEAIEFMEENEDISNFAGFYDFEIDKLKRNLEALCHSRNTPSINVEIERKNFVDFFDQYDTRRNVSLKETFPELAEHINKW